MKKIITLFTVAAAAALLAADPSVGTVASPFLVKIDNFSFTPQTLTVPAGTKVTWINKDDVPHTVRSNDKTIKSRVLDTDDQFSYTFSTPGTNSYFCSIHPHMTGKIIVR
jgi:plastocyanin